MRTDTGNREGADMQHIMIVEDDHEIARIVQQFLEQAGFCATLVADGREALTTFKRIKPALVILDQGLPSMSGTEVFDAIKLISTTPVIFLTAKTTESDRIQGLQMGADDYVCKPFSVVELVLRVKAVLARAQVTRTQAVAVNQTANQCLLINQHQLTVQYGDYCIDLTVIEFRLLALLATRHGVVFTRAQIMNAVYEDYRVVNDRTVDSHVRNLRAKLTVYSADYEWIESVYSAGYRYKGPAVNEQLDYQTA